MPRALAKCNGPRDSEVLANGLAGCYQPVLLRPARNMRAGDANPNAGTLLRPPGSSRIKDFCYNANPQILNK